jgi:hypothetical protein
MNILKKVNSKGRIQTEGVREKNVARRIHDIKKGI